ncbi:hypothetical protein B484DRAFT_294875, partial [Ochromonadaceae sp. CCMP2298]
SVSGGGGGSGGGGDGGSVGGSGVKAKITKKTTGGAVGAVAGGGVGEGVGGGGGLGTAVVLDYASLPPSQFHEHHLPILPFERRELGTRDLSTLFPDMYLPADFVAMTVGLGGLQNSQNSSSNFPNLNFANSNFANSSTHGEFVSELVNTMPVLMHSIPSKERGTEAGAGTGTETEGKVFCTRSDVLDPPTFTYTNAYTCNNSILGPEGNLGIGNMRMGVGNMGMGVGRVTVKPVKIQVRYISIRILHNSYILYS